MGHNRCAILGRNDEVANLLSDILQRAGFDSPRRSEHLQVAKLAAYAPEALMIDFDHFSNEKLESVRQIRFVLPECAIAVVSSNLTSKWAAQCHMAGANGVLSRTAGSERMLGGLQSAVLTGCYTDPDFSVAPR